MAYEGYDFIYDGMASALYGMRICAFESLDYRYAGGSAVEIVSDKAARSIKTNVLGVFPADVLEFDLEVYCEEEISLYQADSIKSWLFGQIRPKKLHILRDDMRDIYFNCLLTNPEDIQIDGNNGWKFTVVCDAGGAWELPKTKRYMTGNITVMNQSGIYDYTYPDVLVKMSGAGDVSIINESDDNREFLFTGLQSGEAVTVYGGTKLVMSSSGLNRLSAFNKNFFRLKRGINKLVCSGPVEYVELTTQSFRRLGG